MRIVFILAGLFFTTACSFSGGNSLKAMEGINSQADAQRVVRRGMSMAQVKAKLGPPSVSSTHGNTTRWNYHVLTDPLSAKSLLRHAVNINPYNTRILNVFFNAGGNVKRVEFQAINRS